MFRQGLMPGEVHAFKEVQAFQLPGQGLLADAPDAFVNLNSPAELAAYEASLSHPEPLAGGLRP